MSKTSRVSGNTHSWIGGKKRNDRKKTVACWLPWKTSRVSGNTHSWTGGKKRNGRKLRLVLAGFLGVPATDKVCLSDGSALGRQAS